MLGCADLVEDLPRLDGVLLYPFDATDWQPVPEVDDGVVTVVHAPNHRHYKGTRFLEAAIEQLQAEGLPVEFVVVEGMTERRGARGLLRAPTSSPTSSCWAPTRCSRSRRWRSASRCSAS